MEKQIYTDISYCPSCKKETEQKFIFWNHERDSSNDSQKCLSCGSYRTGYSIEWVTIERDTSND